jgi:hypothetical protein
VFHKTKEMLPKASAGLELLKKSFLDLTGDAVAVCQSGPGGKVLQVVYTNHAFEVLFGAQRDRTFENTFPFAGVHRQLLQCPSEKSKKRQSWLTRMASGFL